jgi:tRNA threonylcarbamoyladenosine biosynthesis protein TsaB
MTGRAGDSGSYGSTHDGRRQAILAIDTATTRVVVASGSPDGRIDGLTTWPAGYRHGETLLPSIGRFLGEQNLRRSRLTAIVVGTGPGAFTGLRVGIATAKGLAHGLGIPIVGVSTGEALLAAAVTARQVGGAAAPDGIADPARASRFVLLLPAGPSDRIVVRPGGAPALLVAGTDPDLEAGEVLVAIDLEGRADDAALERGEAARAGLGAALVEIGAARLAAGDADDLARLVPEYVTLPRGVRAETGEVAWSRDPR